MRYVERKDYNNVISIKLVITSVCNAKCPFCYNKNRTVSFNQQQKFLDGFIDSLDDVIKRIDRKNPISVDITGGEPTLNFRLLINVLIKLRDYNIKSKVLRVTMTTNGTNLDKVIPYMMGVVDYVNISVHDWRFERREEIFGFYLRDLYYKNTIKKLNNIGITVSASAVIFKEIDNFDQWRDNFVDWAKKLGFISVRFRCDVFWKNSDVFDSYLMDSASETDKFDVITCEKTPDSYWCRLRRKDGMRVFFLHGVLDTSIKTKGIEYIIDTNGHCYCDYDRRTKIEDYQYEVGKIYDICE